MADNDVRIRVSLDGAGEVQRGLAGVGDGAHQADSKLGSLAAGGIKGVGAAFAGLATAAAGAGAALAGSVVKSFADYEQNIGGIETMFKGAADKMKGYADQAYVTAGLSANEYMSQVTSFSAALLQGLGGDTDKAADIANLAMVDMSDNANKFGSNIADIQNAYQGFAKQNYTMLDNLKLGYGGTKEEMARLINDSGVLGDTMKVTAETVDNVSFDKIIEAIHKVQDNMGIAGTTSKEASETISGSVGMLKGSFENLLVGLGRADADVGKLAGNVITSLEAVITNVTPVIENIGKNMTTLGPKIGEMIKSLAGVIIQALPTLIQAGVEVIGGLIQGISSAVPEVIPAIIPALIGLVDMVTQNLPLFLDAGIKALITLAEGLTASLPKIIPMIVQMVQKLAEVIADNGPKLISTAVKLIVFLAQGLIKALPDLIKVIPTLVQALVDTIVQNHHLIVRAGFGLFMSLLEQSPAILGALLSGLGQIIISLVEGIGQYAINMASAGKDIFMALFDKKEEIRSGMFAAVEGWINGTVEKIKSFFSNMNSVGAALFDQFKTGISNKLSNMASVGSSLVDTLKNAITQKVSSIGQAAVNIHNAMINKMNELIKEMGNVGYHIVTGLWNGIANRAAWLYNKIVGWANNILQNVYSTFGIHSPSRVFRDQVGKNIVLGMAQGIDENVDIVNDSMDRMNQLVMDNTSKGLKRLLKQYFKDVRNASEEDIRMAVRELTIAYLGGDWGTPTVKAVLGEDKATEIYWKVHDLRYKEGKDSTPVEAFDRYHEDMARIGKKSKKTSKRVAQDIKESGKNVADSVLHNREHVAKVLNVSLEEADFYIDRYLYKASSFGESVERAFKELGWAFQDGETSMLHWHILSGNNIDLVRNVYTTAKDLGKHYRHLTGTIRGIGEDIHAAWDEVNVALTGGDFGSAAIEKLLGSQAGGFIVDQARGIGEHYRKAADSIRSAGKQIRYAIEEIQITFEGGDWGNTALAHFFGPEMSGKMLDFVANLGNATRDIQAQLTQWDVAIRNSVNTLATQMDAGVAQVIQRVYAGVNQAREAGYALFTAVAGRANEAANYVAGQMNNVINGVHQEINRHVEPIARSGRNLLNSVTADINRVQQDATIRTHNMVNSMVDTVDRQTGGMVTNGRHMVEGLWNGINQQSAWLHNQVRGWANDVTRQAQRAFGIHSPSRVFRDEVGRHIATGFGLGIERNAHVALAALRDMNNAMLNESLRLPDITAQQFTQNSLPHGSVGSVLAPTPTYYPPARVTETSAPSPLVNGPLVTVENMQVRNDHDIRALSTQLRQDMSRELRAQGVLV